MASPTQLANLKGGKRYRWRKGESGNRYGRAGRLRRKVPGTDLSYAQAIAQAVERGDVTRVLWLVRQLFRPQPRFMTCPSCGGWVAARAHTCYPTISPQEWARTLSKARGPGRC